MHADDGIDIAVFARAPDPGHANTRLIPRLGATGAARLQEQLIGRALARARTLPGARVTLWTTGPDTCGFMPRAAAAAGAALQPQRGNDLGERMSNAIRNTLTGRSAMLLIGTDCPAQRVEDLVAAAAALAAADAVVQPADDGGYVLIGLRRPLPELFHDIAWGSASVLASTRARAQEHGIRLAELPTCWDLDRADDLDRAVAEGLVELP
jgi:rSAM/selenodomain-associated transferase 1